MYIISLPIVVSCYLTMPDVGKPRWRPWYPATFLVATLWIALYSYLMVWMITVIGEQIIMGGFVPIKEPLGLISINDSVHMVVLAILFSLCFFRYILRTLLFVIIRKKDSRFYLSVPSTFVNKLCQSAAILWRPYAMRDECLDNFGYLANVLLPWQVLH